VARAVLPPDAGDLDAAAAVVAARLAPTPLVAAPALGPGVWLKLESLQPTGSFKARGAVAALSALDGDADVVTASAGNHGLGVAWAATTLGRRATVVVPDTASPAKIAALSAFPDVALVRHGSSYDGAEAHALSLAAAGATYVSPYNDRQVIAGQASLGRELEGALEGPLTVVCPLGGGGLASGLGLWASSARSGGARVVAVESRRSQAFRAALDAGRIVAIEPEPTIADGLGGNLEAGSITFDLVRDHVAEVTVAEEDELEAAVRTLATSCGIVAEGAAAAPVAAHLAGRLPATEGPTVLVLTGRNIAATRLAALLA
jgi:threonine dehydratase